MRATWNGTLSTGRFEALSLPGLAWPIELRPHPRARSLRLRLDEGRGLLTLTCPKCMSRKAALEWARGQASWVEAQLARVEPGEPFEPQRVVPVEGRDVQLLWDGNRSRTPLLSGELLQCGGPREAFSGRVERFLRTRARDRLSNETARVAALAGVTVRSVSVGDAASRWGSCSASGAIRYNWRLILAPSHLLQWVVAHEVAHRVHMNHGPEFRALEKRLFGSDVAAARAELRALGPRLKRVGRPL